MEYGGSMRGLLQLASRHGSESPCGGAGRGGPPWRPAGMRHGDDGVRLSMPADRNGVILRNNHLNGNIDGQGQVHAASCGKCSG